MRRLRRSTTSSWNVWIDPACYLLGNCENYVYYRGLEWYILISSIITL